MKKHRSASFPKVALVYDRVNTRFGGAEHVLTNLHAIFPNAPLFTSVYDTQKANWATPFSIKASFLQKIPFLRKFHRALVLFMPLAFETLHLNEFDIVITITSAEAKGVLTTPDQLHICYLLTPTRYLWSHQDEYQKDFVTGWFRKIVFNYIRWWDKVAAFRPDVIVPISKLVQARTAEYYDRLTLPVIYPPAELEMPKEEKSAPITNEPYYLIVSRLVSYKRIDLAIRACESLGKKLIIIGSGPDKSRLQHLVTQGSNNVLFLTSVQPDQITAYYQNCVAFLAPGEEDFGIATIEALQAGKPAIVYFKSGAAELIENNRSGIFLMQQSIQELENCIRKIEETAWNKKEIQKSVAGQSAVQFQSQFKKMVDEQWQLFEKGYYE